MAVDQVFTAIKSDLQSKIIPNILKNAVVSTNKLLASRGTDSLYYVDATSKQAKAAVVTENIADESKMIHDKQIYRDMAEYLKNKQNFVNLINADS